MTWSSALAVKAFSLPPLAFGRSVEDSCDYGSGDRGHAANDGNDEGFAHLLGLQQTAPKRMRPYCRPSVRCRLVMSDEKMFDPHPRLVKATCGKIALR